MIATTTPIIIEFEFEVVELFWWIFDIFWVVVESVSFEATVFEDAAVVVVEVNVGKFEFFDVGDWVDVDVGGKFFDVGDWVDVDVGGKVVEVEGDVVVDVVGQGQVFSLDG